jgi:predicted P-loop ATPase
MSEWLTSLRWTDTERTRGRATGEHLSSTRERQRIVQGVREFFGQNYELRYNVMKQTEEYRPLRNREAVFEKTKPSCEKRKAPVRSGEAAFPAGEASWQQLTDRDLRRMAIEEMEQVGVAWSIDVELYVRSALIPPYNPVTDFLERCGQWDGQTDHIRLIARRVPTSYDLWPDHFHRWMLAMVAQWMNLSRDYGNSMVPMLIGGQGTHKSTFCRLLLPPELREYYIDDIKLDNAEQVERMLGRMLLVNIDEYNAKTDREQAKIKRVLTEKDVQTRKMRSDQYVMLPRMASFIATTNEREPLCDPTGSRRYLCCAVEGLIDTDTPVDYGQLYAQAVHELKAGHPWHFSKAEEAEIERHNQDYRQQSSPETVLLSYFEPAAPGKDNFIRAVDIQAELRKHVRAADVPTIKALTAALKSCHFTYGAIKGIRGWYARSKMTDKL